MGVWSELAASQFVKFAEMNTRDAMRLIAYWKDRLPTSDERWRPVLAAVIAKAPERKRITNRLVATDLLLNLIFGETETRPSIAPEVQAAVVDYISDSAKILDRTKPDAVPPVIETRLLDQQSERLAKMLKNDSIKPKTGGVGILLLVLLLAASEKRS
jgi:hypothetical protein